MSSQRDRTLRVGILGAGWVAGDRHMPAYAAHPRTQVVAVCDRNPERARALAGKAGASFATDDYDAFLARDLDIVSICTPPFDHAELATAALQAGTHVFLEKPMAMNLEQARGIADAAAAAGRLLCVSHNFLFSRSMRRVLDVIDSGDAGAVRFVMGVQSSSPDRRLPKWYPQLPAGLFFDESPHLLYLMAALLGDMTVVSAQADAAPPGAEQPVRSLQALLSSPVAPATLAMSFDAPISEWHLIVVCERRVLMVDLFRDISVVLGPDGSHGALDILRTSASTSLQHLAGFASSGARTVTRRQHWGHRTLIHRFINAVVTGEPTPVDPADSLRVVAVTDEILRAI